MLVNATEMLQKARDGHYAVGQFNINNLEWTKAALQAAQEMNSPIILGVSEGAGKYMTGFKTVAAMVKAMIDTLGITVPVALHLDHGSYEGAKACVEAGFSSIRMRMAARPSPPLLPVPHTAHMTSFCPASAPASSATQRAARSIKTMDGMPMVWMVWASTAFICFAVTSVLIRIYLL